MAHTHSSLYYHLVWSTKRREPWLTQDVRPRLYSYMAGIFEKRHAKALLIGGVSDHVHALCSTRPAIAVSDIVKEVKQGSSRWFHETYGKSAFAWQEGYGVFTVSPTHREGVYDYIAKQEEHHRQETFEEEYVRFLRRYGIETDERFVFD